MPLAALAVPFLTACKLREERSPPFLSVPHMCLPQEPSPCPGVSALIGQPESRPSVSPYACGSEAVKVTTQPETLAGVGGSSPGHLKLNMPTAELLVPLPAPNTCYPTFPIL